MFGFTLKHVERRRESYINVDRRDLYILFKFVVFVSVCLFEVAQSGESLWPLNFRIFLEEL